ncbi:MAG TPA: beta-1,6-N-acetylglucosaminyltransferase [Rhizomicrobium sp.]|nr:beta-1,6-N-acetylglucosaminyltransferase [Rhizomicrobium sp.]
MRVGYIILAHHKPRQLGRLVRALRAESGGPIFIHVDRRAPEMLAQTVDMLRGVADVTVRSHHKVTWGGFGIVAAALEGLSHLLADTSVGHIQHLSGQDYPIKPVGAFEAMAQASPDTSFMECQALPRSDWPPDGGMYRIRHWYLKTGVRPIRLPVKRALPPGITFYGGSAFWCLARAHAQFALTSGLRDFFRHAFVSDELFFQTVLMNSPWRDAIADRPMCYTSWSGNARSPKTLGRQDLEALAQAPHYFARKFDADIDSQVLDQLDRAAGRVLPSAGGQGQQ